MITQGFACPVCGTWTMVLDTRSGNVRRRECANLHRFYTEEVVLGLLNTKPRAVLPPPLRDSWDVPRMLQLIKKHNGNKAAAAAEMGIVPATFYYRCKQIEENKDEPDTERL